MSKTTPDSESAELTLAERGEVRRLVERVAALRRSIARAEGEIARHTARMAAIAHAQGVRSGNSRGPEYARRSMAGELAAATRVHPSSARSELEQAELLVEGFPATLAALERGDISRRHARVIADAGVSLDRGARASLDAHASHLALTRTAGQTNRIAKLAAADLAPVSLRQRHLKARRDRRVEVTDLDDGMSELLLVLPTFHAHAVHDRLTRLASHIHDQRRAARRAYTASEGAAPEGGWEALFDQAQHAALVAATRIANDTGSSGGGTGSAAGTAGPDTVTAAGTAGSATGDVFSADGSDLARRASDTRTFDQLRADLVADLILSASPTGHELDSAGTGTTLARVTAHVQVTIPAETILDPDTGVTRTDRDALISPDTALIAAASATGWDRLFVSPATGQVLATDRYRPTADQRRFLAARDETCRFPGCTMPASRCDIDHTIEYAAGGPTAIDNLAHLCESHHVMRHRSGWRIRQLGNGILEWTSPTGHTYTDTPPRTTVRFHDAEPSEPRTPAEPSTPAAPGAACTSAAHDASTGTVAITDEPTPFDTPSMRGTANAGCTDPDRPREAADAWLAASGLPAQAARIAEARSERDARATDLDDRQSAREHEKQRETDEQREVREHHAQEQQRLADARRTQEARARALQDLAFTRYDEECFRRLLDDTATDAPRTQGTIVDLHLAETAVCV